MTSQAPSYHGYRFPPEIISYAVWLYYRFGLSFRDVEDLLAQRRVTVTYETIRQWCLTFGPSYARTLRRRRGRLGDTWYLDELFVRHCQLVVGSALLPREIDVPDRSQQAHVTASHSTNALVRSRRW